MAKEVKFEGLESIASTIEKRHGLEYGSIAYFGTDDHKACDIDEYHFHASADDSAGVTAAEVIEEIADEHDGDPPAGTVEARPTDGVFVYHDFDAAIRAEWSA